jgi:hypothetical protein
MGNPQLSYLSGAVSKLFAILISISCAPHSNGRDSGGAGDLWSDSNATWLFRLHRRPGHFWDSELRIRNLKRALLAGGRDWGALETAGCAS